MTDPTFDELASAHLDGATTPDEAARVAADPALQARVEELRRVRAAMAQVPTADPSHRDAAIAAALAAFADEDDATADRGPVASLATLSARRRPSPTVVRVLGAAAAIAVLALLLPVLGRLGTSSDDDSASFDSTGEAVEGGAVSGDDAGEGATPTAERSGEADLGTFEDLSALVEAVSSADPVADVGTDALAVTPEDAGACPLPASGDAASAGRLESARATVAGDAVVVIVRTELSGSRTLLVYRADDCALLAERPL